MGFYDRDYMRAPARRRVALWTPQSVTTWVITINVAVFLLDRILARMGFGYVMRLEAGGQYAEMRFTPLAYWGHFSQLTAIGWLQLWRFITFQFLHADLNHIVFNMLALYFFGPLVEQYLTSRRFLVFYLLCGIGGALMYFVLLMAGFRIGWPWVPLVGASAGIFGVLVAAAMIAPNATVLLMMMVPMPLRTLAWLFIGIAVFQVVVAGQNAGGEAAHLGGAAVGWLLMQRPQVMDLLTFSNRRRRIL